MSAPGMKCRRILARGKHADHTVAPATRALDYAWASFGDAIKSGRFVDPKK